MGVSESDDRVRRLGLSDLGHCRDLAASHGWGAEERTWRLLFAIGDVYGIDDPGGGLAGTVVSTPYGDDVAAIGMVLVAGHRQRQGLGERLMRHAMERAKTASLFLTATDAGRPLYERLGFRSTGLLTSYQGIVDGFPRGNRTAPAHPEDVQDIIKLDAKVFGATRAALVESLPSFCETLRVVRDGTDLVGYGGTWRNVDQLIVGPVLARDEEIALALVEEMARPGPLRLEVDTRHRGLTAWSEEHGLRPIFNTTIMEYGAPVAIDPSRLFLPVALALG
ncbi:GNAT family N-acetyltransferase [Actinomadura roseirufa]|uniref:GNAT family N-acetyltransferase n=1 Tax=Actinomadura roseirufa TaxID=2094049 RepID=UPI0010415314|nr:GNAT family N-acetyltransferase [Actinomadura roseirufa]